jgi:hypothetical protein
VKQKYGWQIYNEAVCIANLVTISSDKESPQAIAAKIENALMSLLKQVYHE